MQNTNTLFDTDSLLDSEKLAEKNSKENPHNLPLITGTKKSTKANPDTPLDKESKKFNKLLADIKQLELELEKRAADEALEQKMYQDVCLPELVKLAAAKLDLVRRLDHIYESNKFKKRETVMICDFIRDFLEDIAQHNEELVTIMNKYMNLSLSLLSKREKEGVKESMHDEFGADFDFENFINSNNKEDYFAKMSEQMHQQYAGQKKEEQLNKKYSNNLTTTSITELYKSLAKQLHPDLETDTTLKLIKEKLMQELGAARENKDLMQMLVIQNKALPYLKNKSSIIDIGLDKLKNFNAILAQKKAALNNQIKMYFFTQQRKSALYRNITPEYFIEKQIKEDAAMLKKTTKDVRNTIAKVYSKDDMLWVIENYLYN